MVWFRYQMYGAGYETGAIALVTYNTQLDADKWNVATELDHLVRRNT